MIFNDFSGIIFPLNILLIAFLIILKILVIKSKPVHPDNNCGDDVENDQLDDELFFLANGLGIVDYLEVRVELVDADLLYYKLGGADHEVALNQADTGLEDGQELAEEQLRGGEGLQVGKIYFISIWEAVVTTVGNNVYQA